MEEKNTDVFSLVSDIFYSIIPFIVLIALPFAFLEGLESFAKASNVVIYKGTEWREEKSTVIDIDFEREVIFKSIDANRDRVYVATNQETEVFNADKLYFYMDSEANQIRLHEHFLEGEDGVVLQRNILVLPVSEVSKVSENYAKVFKNSLPILTKEEKEKLFEIPEFE